MSATSVPVLPDDALVEIFSRVPARSLCRFKCVSRAWRALIADLLLRCSKLPQTLEGFVYTNHDGDEIPAGDNDGDGGGKWGRGGVSSDRVVGRFITTLGRSVPLASFAFLGKQPGIEEFRLLRSCNGLLLLGHRRAGDIYYSLGYIVCNPATEQWVAVPNSGWKPCSLFDLDESEGSDSNDEDTEPKCRFTYLIFDPAVSPRFQLVEFWSSTNTVCVDQVDQVCTYSSETGVWRERTSMWRDEVITFSAGSAFVSGMLHFSVTSFAGWEMDQELIVAVDGEGKSCRIISGPLKHCLDVCFIGQSQGRLHYMTQHRDYTRDMTELSIWVLQDYDTEQWILKHSVTFLQLFGRRNCQVQSDYSVIAIHPDCNLIFFFQLWELKLKSYDMDSKEVCTLHTVGVGRLNIVPYVPFFAQLSALASKH